MSKKILYIVPHRLNRSPGQRFRCEHFIPILTENGYSVTYSNLLTAWDDAYFYKKGAYFFKLFIVVKTFLKRLKDVCRAKNYDIVFVYREAFMLGTTMFERALKKRGAKLIYDFDDSIWLNDTSEGNQNLAWLKRTSKTNDIVALADLTIVGNEYLANHAKQFSKNVAIIPTTINTDYHKPQKANQTKNICIGWTGTETTEKHFRILEPVLLQLKEKYPQLVFRFISNKPYSGNLLVESVKWNATEEIEQLQKIDIGIMPLPNDDWSRGKCGFKGLQYMSLEIPTVMSPVGVNNEIIANGENGYLAETNDEWISILSELIENAELRKSIGKKGRQTIIENYSIESQKEKYVKLLYTLLYN